MNPNPPGLHCSQFREPSCSGASHPQLIRAMKSHDAKKENKKKPTKTAKEKKLAKQANRENR